MKRHWVFMGGIVQNNHQQQTKCNEVQTKFLER